MKGWLVGREGGTRGTPLSFRFFFVFLEFFFLSEGGGPTEGRQPRQTCFEHGPRLFIRLVCRRTFPSPRGPRTLPFLPSTALDLHLFRLSLSISLSLPPPLCVCTPTTSNPARLRNLDLYGRTAHATALQHDQPQAAAFLEAAAAELEPLQPKRHGHGHGGEGTRSITNKRRGGTASSSSCAAVAPGGAPKEGHPPRSSAASPTLRLAQRSGSGSSGGSAQESGASGRPSPVSSTSGGLGSAAGSVLESCNSYEYVESDQE